MPDPIVVNGVAHVVLRVARFEECATFYDRLMPFLGLAPVHRDEQLAYYVGGRTALAIRPASPGHETDAHLEGRAGLDHLCFRARSRADVDAAHAFVANLGADVVRRPQEGPWAPGYYSFSFRDPDGIRLELNHVPGEGVLTAGAAFDAAPDHPLAGPGP